jgi:hypothetical protein
MKGKLNKVDNGYVLLVDNIMYATDNDKLSKENCDEIFGVVDVEELAEEFAKTKSSHSVFQNTHKRDFKAGFNKAMELNEDKVFTLEDIRRAMSAGLSIGYGRQFEIENKSIEIEAYTQSLQQPTEIEVEIVLMKDNEWYEKYQGNPPQHFKIQHSQPFDGDLPKLDSDGCLILKRFDMKKETQEEPNQECTCGVCDYCEEQESIQILKGAKENALKQETLEEAAKIYAKIPIVKSVDEEERYYNSACKLYDAFKAGAKWQSERMYSEEEAIQLLIKFNQEIREVNDVIGWFEKFKKK